MTQSFDEFWAAYPRKVGKGAAITKWAKAIKLAPPYEIMSGLEAAKNEWVMKETETQFIPHPSTWLHQRRWEDEHAEPEKTWWERQPEPTPMQPPRIIKPRVRRMPGPGKRYTPQERQAIIDRIEADEPKRPPVKLRDVRVPMPASERRKLVPDEEMEGER